MNGRQVLGELCLDGHAILHHFAAGQGNDLEDCFVDVQPAVYGRYIPDEGADAADDVAGSMGVPFDRIEGLSDLLQIRPDQGGRARPRPGRHRRW